MATKQFVLVEGLFRHLHVGQASLEKLQLWKERLMSETPFLAAGESYSMQVLNHGDLKWGNIAKLIDFQNRRWSSALNDILYLGTHSIASSVWETQFNELRDAYLEELNLWLTKLGCGRRYEVEDYIHDEELLKPFRINLLLAVIFRSQAIPQLFDI